MSKCFAWKIAACWLQEFSEPVSTELLCIIGDILTPILLSVCHQGEPLAAGDERKRQKRQLGTVPVLRVHSLL